MIPELLAELENLDSAHEEAALTPDPEYPFILMAGRHFSMNANTLMRDPTWNEGKRDCTLIMHIDDAKGLNVRDGQKVRVITAAGSEEIELNHRIERILVTWSFRMALALSIIARNMEPT